MAKRIADFRVSREAWRELIRAMDGKTLLKITGIPDDAKLVAVAPEWDYDGITLRFASDSFDEVEPGWPIPRRKLNIEARPADTADCPAFVAAVI